MNSRWSVSLLMLVPRQAGLVSLNKFLAAPSSSSLYSLLIAARCKARSSSPFPREGGLARIQQLSEKYNPPPKMKPGEALPNDISIKVDSTGQIFSSYVPVERKAFLLTLEGMKQRWEAFKALVVSTYSIGTIKRYVKPFKIADFARSAQKQFVEVNNALQVENVSAERAIRENVTLVLARALKARFQDPARKVHWRFVSEVERPRLVHAQVAPVADKDNLYAQATVRMHTEQILAIQDRYGRLIQGSAKVPKKVIDYVVLERHISDPYGSWRICGKLLPRETVSKSKAPSLPRNSSAIAQ